MSSWFDGRCQKWWWCWYADNDESNDFNGGKRKATSSTTSKIDDEEDADNMRILKEDTTKMAYHIEKILSPCEKTQVINWPKQILLRDRLPVPINLSIILFIFKNTCYITLFDIIYSGNVFIWGIAISAHESLQRFVYSLRDVKSF